MFFDCFVQRKFYQKDITFGVKILCYPKFLISIFHAMSYLTPLFF